MSCPLRLSLVHVDIAILLCSSWQREEMAPPVFSDGGSAITRSDAYSERDVLLVEVLCIRVVCGSFLCFGDVRQFGMNDIFRSM